MSAMVVGRQRSAGAVSPSSVLEYISQLQASLTELNKRLVVFNQFI